MADSQTRALTPFQTHPSRYRHWTFSVTGDVARLGMQVQEEEDAASSYVLKQNSYDLNVDIELNDALHRIIFEHPQVKVLVVTSELDRIFCAGANIYMLGRSSHAFKQNFCRYTNETRILIEEMSSALGIRSLAALNGTAAGGGYELAMACDEIALVDDGNSAVSLPEVPLLGVLPGTGGLTRLVDKRRVRRDRADIFCTISEGVKGRRAVEWGLVDHLLPKSSFQEKTAELAARLSAESQRTAWEGIELADLEPRSGENGLFFDHVSLEIDEEERTATLTVAGPGSSEPVTADEMVRRGSELWALAAFRELDRALLHLRIDYPEIGLVLLRTKGAIADLLRVDRALEEHRDHGFVQAVLSLMGRTLRRLDLSAKSFFALIEPESCFAGSLLELALAADRTYMLADDDDACRIAVSSLQRNGFPMTHGLTRLEARFLDDEAAVQRVMERTGDPLPAGDAEDLGLVTMALDDLDYEDETRLAIEERASLSPDALTGMEASLRFPGPESMESKIFGRLTAWQNWIFQRPNAVGKEGALTTYGQPSRPVFDYRRT